MPGVRQQFVVAKQAVAFDAVGTAALAFNQTTSSMTFNGSHTAAGGSSCVVLLFVDVETNGSTGPASISATYNGVSMTALTVWNYTDDGSGDLGNVAAFYLFNPPTGAKTVSTTISTAVAGPYFVGANTVSYNNVNTIGSIVTNTSDGSVGPTLSMTNTAGSMVSMMFGDTSSAGGFGTFSGFNKTSRYNNTADSVGSYMMIGDTSSAPNANFTASQSWSIPWAAIGVPLNP